MSRTPSEDYKPGPAVPVLEPQEGDWSTSNFWGDQFNSKRAPDGTTNFPKAAGQVLGVLPKNNRMYGPPKTMTVSLYRSDDPQIGNADFYARVTYGTGGGTNSFMCDWLAGMRFSLTMNNVNVDAVSYAPNSQAPYAPDVTDGFFLGAMVTEGGAGDNAPLTFTEPLTVIPTLQHVDFAAPDFARRLLIHTAVPLDPTVDTGIFVQFRSGSVGLAGYDLRVMRENLSDGILIPGGCREVRISNTTGADFLVTPQWVLGI